MVSNINDDRMALAQQVEDALKRLIRQTLVQKNGDIYVFLTDEEQEINRAIESQNVDSGEVIAKVSEMIFDGLYDEKKYRYPAFNGRYAFAFNQIVDDKPYKANQNNDITLKILTPNSDERADETTMRIMSGQSNCVLVVLPDDRTFLDEIRTVLKIEKFIRYDATNSITKFESIKEAKKVEMRERNGAARLFLSESLKNAEIYVNGDKIQSGAKEIIAKINEALGKLVSTVYHKLSYIDTAMSETDIRLLFKSNEQQLTLENTKTTKNELALNDVNDYIALNTQRHMKTSMKSILERFLKAPYGFVEADVQWLVAKLFKNGEISMFVNNDAVTLLSKTPEEIIRYLTRKEFNEKLMTEKRVKANEKQKKSVREVMKELFNVTSASDDDDAIMRSFLGYASNLKNELEKLDVYYASQPAYPGKQFITSGKKLMADVLQTKYSNEFFAGVDRKKDDFLDFAEDYEPVKKFFAGEQKGIFDKALKLMKIYDDSKTFIVNSEIEDVAASIKIILKKSIPYFEIFKLPDLLDKFINLYDELLNEMQKPIDIAIQEARQRVFDELKDKKCHDKLADKYVHLFNEISDKAESCNNVATLQNIKVEADALKVRCLNEIEKEEAKLIAEEQSIQVEGNENHIEEIVTPSVAVPKIKRKKTVSIKSINNATTWQLENEADVKRYISELENKLMNMLEEDTIINIEF